MRVAVGVANPVNLFLSSCSLLLLIFEIFDLMLSDWFSFLVYPNLFVVKDFIVVVVIVRMLFFT
jgi:hypothetical protein